MADIALGVVVFQRTEKLKQLLDSIGDPIETVYVADNGDTDERRGLYSRPYPFDLRVLDLPYDSGLGHGRNKIVDRLTEEYLAIVDSDMLVPDNVGVLADQLDARPELGGVSGLLLEDGNLSGACCDLFEESDLLIKDIRTAKGSQLVAGYPLVEFDFVPNAAMFRKACLTEYSWDSAYRIGMEHLDFFTAHKRRSDWVFGTCPSVVFPHFPGGDDSYTAERRSSEKLAESERHFLDKWGYEQYLTIQGRWVESFSDSRLRTWRFLLGYGVRHGLRALPAAARLPAMQVLSRLRYR